MTDGGFYNTQQQMMNSLYMRATASYDKMLTDDFRFGPMIGADMRRTNRSSAWNDGYGYSWNGGGNPVLDYRMIQELLVNGSEYYGFAETYDRAVGLFANVALSWKERYILNLIGRYDGSNRMGRSKDARWLPTWSVSGKWDIFSEEFMKEQTLFSSLALRASYGLTADLGPVSNSYVQYFYGDSWRPLTNVNQSDVETSIYINSLANDDLTWEKQYELNVGVDMGFWMNV